MWRNLGCTFLLFSVNVTEWPSLKSHQLKQNENVGYNLCLQNISISQKNNSERGPWHTSLSCPSHLEWNNDYSCNYTSSCTLIYHITQNDEWLCESFMEEEWWEGQGKKMAPKKTRSTVLCALKWLAVWLVLTNMTRGVCEVTLSCILLLLSCSSGRRSGSSSSKHTPLSGPDSRVGTDVWWLQSCLFPPTVYPKSHLPPSKTLIIPHFVVPVHCSVISCHHCTLQLLPLIIVVIAKVKEQLLYLVFFPTSFQSIWNLNKALAQFLLTWANWQAASQISAGKWNNTAGIMERQMG